MATDKLYGPSPEDGHLPDTGYRIVERSPGGWFWIWSEPGEEDQVSDRYGSESAAFDSAADDWADCGEGGRLTSTLRAQATRLRGQGR